MKGRIHSIESFGTVDGPGVRLVVFVKGCPMRCLYCHNPDTWTMDGAEEMEAEEIIRQFNSARGFYRNGGITVPAGNPSPDGISHRAVLSGKSGEDPHLHRHLRDHLPAGGSVFMEKLNALLALTDLILLDIKHIDPEEHKKTLRPAKRSHPGLRQISE